MKQIEKEQLELRYKRPVRDQLIDVWGEADKAVKYYRQYKKRIFKKKHYYESALSELDAVQRVCNIIYSNPNVSEGCKYELRVAEWELYDYILWNNRFRNNSKSVMLWLNHWLYDSNQEIIEVKR